MSPRYELSFCNTLLIIPDRIRGPTIAAFMQYAPHFTGPITPEESVKLCMQVVDEATVESMGGEFVSQFGNKQWL